MSSEGIPMCTLQNFPYLPVHCIEWARSSFSRFETQPKLYNTFMENKEKFMEQVNTAQGDEQYQMVKVMEKLVTRIKNLIHLFPEDEVVKDKETGEVLGNFWTGHKKFPQVPQFDGDSLGGDAVIDYLYAQSQLWAFAFNVAADAVPKNKAEFVAKAKAMKLALPEWEAPVGLKVKAILDRLQA